MAADELLPFRMPLVNSMSEKYHLNTQRLGVCSECLKGVHTRKLFARSPFLPDFRYSLFLSYTCIFYEMFPTPA